MGADKGHRHTLADYGILPYIIRVVEMTNDTFDKVMSDGIISTLYLANYGTELENLKNEMFKQQQRMMKARRR